MRGVTNIKIPIIVIFNIASSKSAKNKKLLFLEFGRGTLTEDSLFSRYNILTKRGMCGVTNKNL